MRPNDADWMANSVDPDQTAPLGAVWSGSTLFAQAYLSYFKIITVEFFSLDEWATVKILSFRTDMPGSTLFAIPSAWFGLITLW